MSWSRLSGGTLGRNSPGPVCWKAGVWQAKAIGPLRERQADDATVATALATARKAAADAASAQPSTALAQLKASI